jgi:uncharacterized RDD family membrane protein YckC
MSLEENPYAPPKADLTEPIMVPRDSELARRSTRFVAAFVDGLIGLAISIPMMIKLGIWDSISRQQTPPLGLTILAAILGFLAFVLVHGYLLKTNGQTVGKWLTKIRIADLDGHVPSFATLILRRYLPISLVAQIPLVGSYLPLIDCLFIFREDRRCVHDLIAHTKVVTIRSRDMG